MATMRSTYARRKGTGRKPKKLPIRRKPVHVRRHRRFKGIHRQPTGSFERNRARALVQVAKRRAARAPLRAALRARVQARARALAAARAAASRAHPRRSGPRRTFKRAYHGRKVKPGLHRRFLGRKAPTKPRAHTTRKKKAAVVQGAAISPQSYINMF